MASTTINSPNQAALSGASHHPAIPSPTHQTPMPTKWTPGKALNSSCYWDQPLPGFDLKREKHVAEFPPDGMDLSDAWVVKIIRSDLKRDERFKRWPEVFSSRRLISSYRNKGQASEHLVAATGKWHYDVVFKKFQMCGDEGAEQGLKLQLNRTVTGSSAITGGQECVIQEPKFIIIKNESLGFYSRGVQIPSQLTPTPNPPLAANKRRRIGNTGPPRYVVPIVTDSSSDEENELETRRDQDEAHHRLLKRAQEIVGQAKGKMVLMAETISAVHMVIGPLIKRTADAAAMLKVATRLYRFLPQEKVLEKKKELDAMKIFYRDNAEQVEKLLYRSNEAFQRLHECFPSLANRMFSHTDTTLQEMKEWALAPLPDYGKLIEVGDARVDHAGRKVDAGRAEKVEETAAGEEVAAAAGGTGAQAEEAGTAGTPPRTNLKRP